MPSPTDRPIGPNDHDPRDDNPNWDDGLHPDHDDIFHFDPLLAELRSSDFDSIRLETAVGLFVEDFEEGFPNGDAEDHPSLETISAYLRASEEEDYADIADRLHTVRGILDSEIPKHTTDNDVANGALQSICLFVFSDVGSCLTGQALSVFLERYEAKFYEEHISRFCVDVAKKSLQLSSLKDNAQMPLKTRKEEARKIQKECEGNADLLLKAVQHGERSIRASLSSLVGEAVQQLTKLEPTLTDEFTALLQEQLLEVYRDDFNQRLSAIAREQRKIIKEARSMVREIPPAAAQPTA